MKTGCTADILRVLRRARKPMTCRELVAAMGGRHAERTVSGCLVNLVTRGVVHRGAVVGKQGRSRSAYSLQPVALVPKPKSRCLLAEVWRGSLLQRD